MNILVVKLSSMGDIVFATPCLGALRSKWPGARIMATVNEEFTALLANNPDVDGLIVRARTKPVRRLMTLRQAAWAGLKSLPRRFDLAIDLQGNFHSAAWTYLSGARRRVGLGDWRPGWDFSLPIDLSRHAVDQNAAVLEKLGIHLPDRVPRLLVAQRDDAFIADLVRRRGLSDRNFLIVHPFSVWRSKEWPIDRYASILRRMSDIATVLITGSAAESQGARELCEMAGGRACSLAGELTLGQCLALWSRARLFIGGDTGPLHVSAALGVPTVALFGPTLPEVTGPIGQRHRILQASRPKSHEEYRSPDGRHHMLAISEKMVLDSLHEMLS